MGSLCFLNYQGGFHYTHKAVSSTSENPTRNIIPKIIMKELKPFKTHWPMCILCDKRSTRKIFLNNLGFELIPLQDPYSTKQFNPWRQCNPISTHSNFFIQKESQFPNGTHLLHKINFLIYNKIYMICLGSLHKICIQC